MRRWHHHDWDPDDDPGLGDRRGRPYILRYLSDRLDATPAQERTMAAAFDEFRDEARGLRDEVSSSRKDVAAALRKPSFDEVLMGELYARHDTAIEKLRKAFVGMMAKVHDALEEPQREQLAQIIERGPGRSSMSAASAGALAGRIEIAVPLRVLCIEDDQRLFQLLAELLRPQRGEPGASTRRPGGPGGAGARGVRRRVPGHHVARDGRAGGLPAIRERSRIPVIMLTAKGDEADRVVGLEIGADDYVAKPFSPRELLARLRAVLRRTQPEAAGEEIVIGDVLIDGQARTVRRGEASVELTGLEFDILLALARRAGRVVPRETLLEEAGRGDTVVSDRTVDVHVSHLRRKLGDDPRVPRLIKTIRGVGYILARDND